MKPTDDPSCSILVRKPTETFILTDLAGSMKLLDKFDTALMAKNCLRALNVMGDNTWLSDWRPDK